VAGRGCGLVAVELRFPTPTSPIFVQVPMDKHNKRLLSIDAVFEVPLEREGVGRVVFGYFAQRPAFYDWTTDRLLHRFKDLSLPAHKLIADTSAFFYPDSTLGVAYIDQHRLYFSALPYPVRNKPLCSMKRSS